MLRLSAVLLVGLWISFIVWGTPVASTADARTTAPEPKVRVVTASVRSYAVPTILSPENARPLAESASTRAATPAVLPLPTPTPVSAPQTATPEPEATPVAVDLPPLYTVTGSRVNMRSGPSTDNPVVIALSLGSVTEALGPEIDGWIEIRDLDSGVSGFMAARFLEAL